jgi:hypothetical protein
MSELSFTPSGLVLVLFAPHGLRRGLHSFAASRLAGSETRPYTFATGVVGGQKTGRGLLVVADH